MKALHVFTLYSSEGAFGGPATVAISQASALRRRGVDVDLVALQDERGIRRSDIEGVPSHLFGPEVQLPGLGFSGLYSYAMQRWIEAKGRDFDIAHIHLGRHLSVLLAAASLKRSGVPLVIQTHGMIATSRNPLSYVVDPVLVRPILGAASAILTLTSREERELKAVDHRISTKFVRIANGVATPHGQVREMNVPPRVLFMARLHRRKQPHVFLAAARQLLSEGLVAKFVVAGPDGGEASSVKVAVDELNDDYRGSIAIAGPLDNRDAIRLLESVDVYVLPSLNEPFPMTILEALSVGTPVVCTSESGIAEVLATVDAARVVAPQPGAVAAAVRSLITDPLQWSIASRLATGLVQRNFNIDRIASQLVLCYQSHLAA